MINDVIGIIALSVLLLNAVMLLLQIWRNPQNICFDKCKKQTEVDALQISEIKARIAVLNTEIEKQDKQTDNLHHLESEQAKMTAQIDELRHDIRDLKCH